MSMSYKDSGVDISAGNVFVGKIQSMMKRTFGPEVVQNEGGFGGLFELNNHNNPLLGNNMENPVMVACTDGVGTKLKIAIMADKHDTIGIDLVAMSVNDLVVQGAAPLFFLDYLACHKLEPEKMTAIVEGVSNGCLQSGAALLGGETAEMSDMYAPNDYDLAGFAVGIVEKNRMILGDKIQAGDKIIGLNSNGIHSNGYSLVRKIFFDRHDYKLDQHIDDLGCTLGEELLKPTSIYVMPILSLLKSYQRKYIVHGIVHVTGGGLTENIPRILPAGLKADIDRKSWETPPIFNLMQELGEIEEEEMYRVFNMGIGMCVIAPEYNAEAIIEKLRKEKQTAQIIGQIVTD